MCRFNGANDGPHQLAAALVEWHLSIDQHALRLSCDYRYAGIDADDRELGRNRRLIGCALVPLPDISGVAVVVRVSFAKLRERTIDQHINIWVIRAAYSVLPAYQSDRAPV